MIIDPFNLSPRIPVFDSTISRYTPRHDRTRIQQTRQEHPLQASESRRSKDRLGPWLLTVGSIKAFDDWFVGAIYFSSSLNVGLVPRSVSGHTKSSFLVLKKHTGPADHKRSRFLLRVCRYDLTDYHVFYTRYFNEFNILLRMFNNNSLESIMYYPRA